MQEAEKQEGQKTVVAFIAGLLIGGLLVWVFSASPEKNEEVLNVENDDVAGTFEEGTPNIPDAPNMTKPADTVTEAVGSGTLEVSAQPAGLVVVLTKVAYPTKNGWIVVRDYENNATGKILGASRYSQDTNLMPQSVNLLRATESGKTYQVTFFSENGDKVFDLDDDKPIEGFAATFTAN